MEKTIKTELMMLEYITTLNTGRETSRKNYKNRDNDAENMRKKKNTAMEKDAGIYNNSQYHF